MSLRSIVEAWLPYPKYAFVGGPYDGQLRVVDLIKLPDGMHAPRIWNIADIPAMPLEPIPDTTAMMNCEVITHAYRFVARRGSINQGHYEYVEPAAAKLDRKEPE